MTKKIRGQLGPLLAPFFLKSSDQNFEIAILFIIVEKPNNYAFAYKITPPPTAPGGKSLSYRICPLFTHSICYWEVWLHFGWGWRRIFCWGFSMEREVSRAWTCQGKLYTGRICQNSYTKLFLNVLLSLFHVNFTHGVVKGNRPGYIFIGIELSSVYFHGKADFSVEARSDLLALLKKRSEIKKQVF